jgi:hypothetical protein
MFIIASEIVGEFQIKESEIDVTRTRVRILNSIMEDLQYTYFDRLIAVSSKNSLIGISNYYDIRNYDVIEYQLWRALNFTIHDGVLPRRYQPPINLKGSLCISQSFFPSGSCVHGDYTLNEMLTRLENIYASFGIDIVEFNVEIVNIEQPDPYILTITADIEYYFKDKSNIASWRGFTRRTVDVSVYGLYYDGIITGSWSPDCGTNSVLKKLDGLPC